MAQAGDEAAARAALAQFALPDPEAWFVEVFGADKGAELAAKYPGDPSVVAERLTRALPTSSILQLPRHVTGRRVTGSADPSAMPDQLHSLGLMTTPAALYGVTVAWESPEPMQQSAVWLRSFAYVDGTFRYIGLPDWRPPPNSKAGAWVVDYDW